MTRVIDHDVLERVLATAMRSGGDFAEVYAEDKRSTSAGLDDGRTVEVERLIGLGARKLWDGQQGPYRWVTMADPEGNEFCVA